MRLNSGVIRHKVNDAVARFTRWVNTLRLTIVSLVHFHFPGLSASFSAISNATLPSLAHRRRIGDTTRVYSSHQYTPSSSVTPILYRNGGCQPTRRSTSYDRQDATYDWACFGKDGVGSYYHAASSSPPSMFSGSFAMRMVGDTTVQVDLPMNVLLVIVVLVILGVSNAVSICRRRANRERVATPQVYRHASSRSAPRSSSVSSLASPSDIIGTIITNAENVAFAPVSADTVEGNTLGGKQCTVVDNAAVTASFEEYHCLETIVDNSEDGLLHTKQSASDLSVFNSTDETDHLMDAAYPLILDDHVESDEDTIADTSVPNDHIEHASDEAPADEPRLLDIALADPVLSDLDTCLLVSNNDTSTSDALTSPSSEHVDTPIVGLLRTSRVELPLVGVEITDAAPDQQTDGATELLATRTNDHSVSTADEPLTLVSPSTTAGPSVPLQKATSHGEDSIQSISVEELFGFSRASGERDMRLFAEHTTAQAESGPSTMDHLFKMLEDSQLRPSCQPPNSGPLLETDVMRTAPSPSCVSEDWPATPSDYSLSDIEKPKIRLHVRAETQSVPRDYGCSHSSALDPDWDHQAEEHKSTPECRALRSYPLSTNLPRRRGRSLTRSGVFPEDKNTSRIPQSDEDHGDDDSERGSLSGTEDYDSDTFEDIPAPRRRCHSHARYQRRPRESPDWPTLFARHRVRVWPDRTASQPPSRSPPTKSRNLDPSLLDPNGPLYLPWSVVESRFFLQHDVF